jgi:hypothetical protein
MVEEKNRVGLEIVSNVPKVEMPLHNKQKNEKRSNTPMPG